MPNLIIAEKGAAGESYLEMKGEVAEILAGGRRRAEAAVDKIRIQNAVPLPQKSTRLLPHQPPARPRPRNPAFGFEKKLTTAYCATVLYFAR